MYRYSQSFSPDLYLTHAQSHARTLSSDVVSNVTLKSLLSSTFLFIFYFTKVQYPLFVSGDEVCVCVCETVFSSYSIFWAASRCFRGPGFCVVRVGHRPPQTPPPPPPPPQKKKLKKNKKILRLSAGTADCRVWNRFASAETEHSSGQARRQMKLRAKLCAILTTNKTFSVPDPVWVPSSCSVRTGVLCYCPRCWCVDVWR